MKLFIVLNGGVLVVLFTFGFANDPCAKKIRTLCQWDKAKLQ